MNDWEKQQPYAYWMECVCGLGRKTRWELVETAGTPKAVYEMPAKDWHRLLPERKAKALEQAKREIEEEDAEKRYLQFCKGEIRYISNLHPDYPKRLRNIPDPPFGIFVWGKLPQEQQPAVAVIGARECSEYGRYMAQRLAGELAARGISVISGMARGIDGISQWAALQADGDTYAVLGNGADICYPSEHRKLYEALKTRGGILSEYLPGTQPKAGLFPLRNRIISGLSDIVLIIEAREKSGTLITADMALEQGREVYAVPGRLTDPLSRGCNHLIKQGAGIMLSLEEMLEETKLFRLADGVREKEEQKVLQSVNEPEEREEQRNPEKTKRQKDSCLLAYLDFYPKSVERLQKESGMEYRRIVCELMELCVENKAEQISAGQYVRKQKN